MSKTNGKTRKAKPSSKGADGRDSDTGQFVKGWKGGPGNPHASHVQRIRALIFEATTDEQFKKVWNKLKSAAENGKPWAIKEYLDRVIGKPHQSVEVTGDMRQTFEVVQAGVSKLSERFGYRKVDLS